MVWPEEILSIWSVFYDEVHDGTRLEQKMANVNEIRRWMLTAVRGYRGVWNAPLRRTIWPVT